MPRPAITTPQANRLREDFKRAAHVQRIIRERKKEKPINDPIMEMAITLMLEEYDAIHRDFDGMLDGNGAAHEEH